MGESRRKTQRAKKVAPSVELSRALVFASDDAVHRKFNQQCGHEIESFIEAAFLVHRDIDATLACWPKNKRSQHVRIFLYVALNALYCSVHFLVSGYFAAAGHQLRLFAEASAMAMLMLTDKEWAAFCDKQERYSAHEALTRVVQRENRRVLEKKLNLDVEGWSGFAELTKLYDHHSHAGAFGMLLALKMEWPYAAILGGEYDPAKRTEYRADLRRAASGAKVLRKLVRAIDAVAQEIA